MYRRMSCVAALLAGVLSMPAPAPAAGATPAAGMIDLGAGEVFDVNQRGDVFGFTADEVPTEQYAIWGHRHHRRMILDSPGYHGARGDINERGDAVSNEHLWRGGRLTELAHPLGGPTVATAINDRGAVAGYRYTMDGTRAFLWENGVFTDFPEQIAQYSMAVDLNNRGQVLVIYDLPGMGEMATAVWWHGRVTDLGGLGGRFPWTAGRDINDRGTVTGVSSTANRGDQPFVWQDGVMTQPAGTTESRADIAALSERGDMVGHIGFAPVLWRHGVPIELAPGRQGRATAVNERGDVAGILIDYTDAGTNVFTPFRWRDGRLTTYVMPEGADSVGVQGIDLHGRLACTGGFDGALPGDPTTYHVWMTR